MVKVAKLVISSREKWDVPDSAHGPERTHAAQSKLLGEPFGLLLKPGQDVLLVLCDPFDVGPGPLDGLIQGQCPRTKSNLCVVLLKLQQLLTKAAEELNKMPSRTSADQTGSEHPALRTRVSNLLKLKVGGEAFRDSIDEVGEGEGSTTVPVRGEALFQSAAKTRRAGRHRSNEWRTRSKVSPKSGPLALRAFGSAHHLLKVWIVVSLPELYEGSEIIREAFC